MYEDVATCINLLKTIIGGGILYFPMLFMTYGWLFTVILSILASMLSIFGLSILSLCSIKCQRQDVSISSLARDCIPKFRFLVDFFVFIKCFGVSIAYLIIAKQTFKRVLVNLYSTKSPIDGVANAAAGAISNLYSPNPILNQHLHNSNAIAHVACKQTPVFQSNFYSRKFLTIFTTSALIPNYVSSLYSLYSNIRTYEIVNIHSVPDERVVLLMFLFMISPFTFFRKITRLKYTSFLGIFAVLIVLLTSIYRFFTAPTIRIRMIATPTYPWLRGIGSFIFSFTCHHNLMTLQNEIRCEKSKSDLKIISEIKRLKVVNCNNGIENINDCEPNPFNTNDGNKIYSPKRAERPTFSRMLKIIIFCILFSLIFYISFGYINASLYAAQVHDNIIESMPSDNISTFVFILYIFVMGFSYPLQLNPCRLYFLSMVGIDAKYGNYDLVFNLTTMVLLAVTYFIAVSGIDLGVVYAFIGSSASVIICLILPPVYFFKMNFLDNVFLKFICYFLLCIGVLVMFSMCLYYIVGV